MSTIFGMGKEKARNCHFGLSKCELRYEPEARKHDQSIGFSGCWQRDFLEPDFRRMPVVQSRIPRMPPLLARASLLRRAAPQSRIPPVPTPSPTTVPSYRKGEKNHRLSENRRRHPKLFPDSKNMDDGTSKHRSNRLIETMRRGNASDFPPRFPARCRFCGRSGEIVDRFPRRI